MIQRPLLYLKHMDDRGSRPCFAHSRGVEDHNSVNPFDFPEDYSPQQQ